MISISHFIWLKITTYPLTFSHTRVGEIWTREFYIGPTAEWHTVTKIIGEALGSEIKEKCNLKFNSNIWLKRLAWYRPGSLHLTAYWCPENWFENFYNSKQTKGKVLTLESWDSMKKNKKQYINQKTKSNYVRFNLSHIFIKNKMFKFPLFSPKSLMKLLHLASN